MTDYVQELFNNLCPYTDQNCDKDIDCSKCFLVLRERKTFDDEITNKKFLAFHCCQLMQMYLEDNPGVIIKSEQGDHPRVWITAISKEGKKEPCDAISRQAAIDLANELKDDLPDDDHLSDMVMSHNEGVLEYQTKLSLLSPVTPQPKIGRWISGHEETGALGITYTEKICSNCGWSHSLIIPNNYCPKCGARMETESEDE